MACSGVTGLQKVRGRGSGGCRSAWHAVGLQLRECGGEAVGGCRSSMQWGRSPEIEGERYRGCVAVACSGAAAEKVRGRDTVGVSQWHAVGLQSRK